MRNKYQPVSFRDPDDFFDSLQGEERKVTLALRNIIFSVIPDLREYLAYNVPFYARRKRLCYLWPASVPWGGLKPGEGVSLGFCQGHLLRHGGYLKSGSRKHVALKVFSSVREIDEMLIAGLLAEAQEADSRS